MRKQVYELRKNSRARQLIERAGAAPRNRMHRRTKNVSVGVCSICGQTAKLDMHHTEYDPTLVNEKTIPVCRSCHRNIHVEMKRNGIELPFSLEKISSIDARSRALRKYRNDKEYRERNISRARQYTLKYIRRVQFYEQLGPNISLHEIISYNQNAGTVLYHAYFNNQNGVVYPEVSI